MVKWSENVFNNILRADNTSLSRRVQFENRCSSHIYCTLHTYSVPTEKLRVSYFDADSPTRADGLFIFLNFLLAT